MRLLVLCLSLALLGCAAKIGPGEHGFFRYEFWKGFNFELDFPTRLCLGCLEVVEEDLDEEPE